jgi:hypothetical protein
VDSLARFIQGFIDFYEEHHFDRLCLIHLDFPPLGFSLDPPRLYPPGTIFGHPGASFGYPGAPFGRPAAPFGHPYLWGLSRGRAVINLILNVLLF